MPRVPASWTRLALVGLAIAVGIHQRTRGIGELPLYGDEYHTLLAADEDYGTILTSFDSVGSHVPLPLLQRLSLDLFGDGVLAFRLVALVPGILTLFLCYPFARRFAGPTAAVLATWALALSPIHVYYSRFARSYALVVLLALGAAWSCLHLLESQERRRAARALLVLTAALLPWVHLSSAGFVLALGLAAIGLAFFQSRKRGLELLALFALAGVACALLYVPVLSDVRAYFEERSDSEPPLDWFGVPLLLAGGPVEAVVWLAALPLGLIGLARTRRATAVIIAAAIAGPTLVLARTLPLGMDYAYSRYLLAGWPCWLALVAWAFVAGFARVLGDRLRAERVALGAGLVLLGLGFLLGPIGPGRPKGGAFANTYLALHELPAFDEPFADTPGFYRELAADPGATRIVEALPIYTRAVLLYRNYALQHGKEVFLGWAGDVPRGVRGAPYVRLLELEPLDADYVVLHRDPLPEVRAYFRFVYEGIWPGARRWCDASFMKLNEKIYGSNLAGPEATDPIASRLRERFGTAHYKDERILVWKLAPGGQ